MDPHSTVLQHPYYIYLRDESQLTQVHHALQIDESKNKVSLTGNTLSGEHKIAKHPVIFSMVEHLENSNELNENKLTAIFHLGSEVCGHPGIVHGGMLATLLDENLCRCAFPLFSGKIGVTASLKIDYRSPTLANSFVVLKAWTTSKSGRKVHVKGIIETLSMNSDAPKLLAEAEMLVIEPRWADKLS
ncbi:hypothetical protein PP7435_CHR4-0054 [Komagataella phaffii CBS 7435]|uniref:Thioesterase domain-containing protein n=2 Tax=Komagataella phaffii TaxID=460519 RepID=C4R992_KOMPG|nr:uncharacterized protein PAS_chr4_0897 [Komagataella phaffii GS115]AOA64978.1 GQ67_05340T0 [Komagataella phaffii]KAI0460758.1 hypothetical protein LJB42_001616 [Komagataella kurtzmanii]CAH2450386.1 hypothetical protein BQ9382_C4-0115 [Komagataella phaffii CBS 7435]AOA70084.1 GQ68_05273T0 [Komagataella phaffii GS115]CAY72167.1 hypothetical protein PAS_chr4_0897 [Komagataella phaffii GS115]